MATKPEIQAELDAHKKRVADGYTDAKGRLSQQLALIEQARERLTSMEVAALKIRGEVEAYSDLMGDGDQDD